LRRHDSELLVLVVNDAHFASPDSLVHPNVFVDGLDLLNRQMRQTFTLTNYLTRFQSAAHFRLASNVRLGRYGFIEPNLTIPCGKPIGVRPVYGIHRFHRRNSDYGGPSRLVLAVTLS
jgi:hypothetical protein